MNNNLYLRVEPNPYIVFLDAIGGVSVTKVKRRYREQRQGIFSVEMTKRLEVDPIAEYPALQWMRRSISAVDGRSRIIYGSPSEYIPRSRITSIYRY